MKAVMVHPFNGKAGALVPGDIVEGKDAIRYVQAGYAVPKVEDRVQKADKPNKAVETR